MESVRDLESVIIIENTFNKNSTFEMVDSGLSSAADSVQPSIAESSHLSTFSTISGIACHVGMLYNLKYTLS